MADDFKDYRRTLEGPADNAVLLTPDNSNDLVDVARALYIGVTGALKVDTAGGDTVTFVAVPVGIFPVRVKRVYATGTDADSIVALS